MSYSKGLDILAEIVHLSDFLLNLKTVYLVVYTIMLLYSFSPIFKTNLYSD